MPVNEPGRFLWLYFCFTSGPRAIAHYHRGVAARDLCAARLVGQVGQLRRQPSLADELRGRAAAMTSCGFRVLTRGGASGHRRGTADLRAPLLLRRGAFISMLQTCVSIISGVFKLVLQEYVANILNVHTYVANVSCGCCRCFNSVLVAFMMFCMFQL